jgi:hypothetical protein
VTSDLGRHTGTCRIACFLHLRPRVAHWNLLHHRCRSHRPRPRPRMARRNLQQCCCCHHSLHLRPRAAHRNLLHRCCRSRILRLRLRTTRQTSARPHHLRSRLARWTADLGPLDQRPVDLRPADLRPMALRPVDMRPRESRAADPQRPSVPPYVPHAGKLGPRTLAIPDLSPQMPGEVPGDAWPSVEGCTHHCDVSVSPQRRSRRSLQLVPPGPIWQRRLESSHEPSELRLTDSTSCGSTCRRSGWSPCRGSPGCAPSRTLPSGHLVCWASHGHSRPRIGGQGNETPWHASVGRAVRASNGV